MKLNIKKWGINGEGIGYLKKKAVFVENAIPGELVEAVIDENHPTYARAHSTEILTPSPRRHHPPCPNWKECGGCSIMNTDYKGQVRMKEQVLKEALRRYAGYTGPIEPMIKNPDPLRYRNACKMPFGKKDGKVLTGMYRRGTSDFVGLERCLIHTKKLETARQALHTLIQEAGLEPVDKDHPDGLYTLVLKEFDDKVHIVLVTGDMKIPQELVEKILEEVPDAASLWQSVKKPGDPEHELFGEQVFHLGGDMKMTLTLGDYSLDLLPKSFFQLNTRQAARLYELIASWIPKKSSLLVEAYSGIGAISLYCADRADQVIGIEYIEDAVANANSNAMINGKENLHFVCADAAKELSEISKKQHVSTLIVDPPRSGLDGPMKEAILSDRPETLIYVSCNPATLGKDLKVLEQAYAIEKVQPFDFFSQTPHVETAVLLRLR